MNREISPKVFIISQITILVVCLTLILALSFYLNDGIDKTNLKNYLPVTSEPISFNLDVNAPIDDLLTFDKSLIISGQTLSLSSIIITINQTTYGLDADSKGGFSKVVTLEPGLNQITVNAFDSHGNTKSLSRTVYYSVEKLP